MLIFTHFLIMNSDSLFRTVKTGGQTISCKLGGKEEKHKISLRPENKTDLALFLFQKIQKSESFVWKCKEVILPFAGRMETNHYYYFSVSKKVWVLTVSLLFENSKCKEVILSFAGRMETNHYCRMLKVTSGNAFQKWPQGLFKNNIYSLLIFKTTYFHYSRNIFIIFFPNIIFTFSFSKQHMFISHFLKQHIFIIHFPNNIFTFFIFKTTYVHYSFF